MAKRLITDDQIRSAFQLCNGSSVKAAAMVGISRSSFWKRTKELGLKIPSRHETVKCATCGVDFRAYQSSNRKVCSRKCAKPMIVNAQTKHGESRSRLHRIWCGMKSRCSGANSLFAKTYYQDRGITVCEEWANKYETFRDWALSNGYSDDLEIDRIDNFKGYSPENCRWATRTQQMQHTRVRTHAKSSKYRGVSRHSQNKNWVAQISANNRNRLLGVFDTQLEAAIAYDEAAREEFKEFATLNFPERFYYQGGVSCL